MVARYFIVFLFVVFYGTFYGQEFAVEIKLKREFKDSVVRNDKQVKSLSQKHGGLELKQSYPGAKNPELLLYYTLTGTENRVESVNDYLKTGLFEDKIQEFEIACITSCNTPVQVNDSLFNNDYFNWYPLNLIQAQCAWSITKGNPSIQIGIVDTDFDSTHEDLKNKIVRVMGPISAGNSHGIGTSGIAGAETNNDKGIASISYNSTIVAHRFIHDSNGRYNSSAARDAIWNMYLEGVPIINLSGTGTGLSLAAAKEITENGTVLVLAAGNDTTSISHSAIANIPGVILVSSVDPNNCFGCAKHARNQWIDICAPGLWVMTTHKNNTYTLGGGTSAAAPIVSGTIALMLSINPNLTPAEIEQIIKQTADTVSDWQQYQGLYGAGRLNAYKAVQKVACRITTLDFINKTVDTDTIIEHCGSIKIQGVKVEKNAKLTIEAEVEVTIEGEFEVESGSEFEIK